MKGAGTYMQIPTPSQPTPYIAFAAIAILQGFTCDWA